MEKHLILIDVQNDFITGALALPGAEAVAQKIKHYVVNHKKTYDSITATLDIHKKEHWETQSNVETRNFPEHCLCHSHGAALYEDLSKHVDFFRGKSTFMARAIDFSYSDEPLEIDICGFATDICVLSNALFLRSRYPRATITVIDNLCVGTTPERHVAAIELMRTNCINISIKPV